MNPFPEKPASVTALANAFEDLKLAGVQTMRQTGRARARRAAESAGPRRGVFADGREQPPTETVALYWSGNRFTWDIGRAAEPSPHALGTPTRRAADWNATPAPPPAGPAVQHLVLERMEKSQVGAALTALDRRLTPGAWEDPGALLPRGPREWKLGVGPVPLEAPTAPGEKVLLFIHGTFSETPAMLEHGLASIPAGEEFLKAAAQHYTRILVFDHPTLSVSASLNALDLARALIPRQLGRLDIVAHSRGGLVARWLCEVLLPGTVGRAVLVGSPLAGTSLAAAPNAREFFDYLTNVAGALGFAASLGGPWIAAVGGLLRVLSAFTGGLARLPVADALVALVPGLQTQARIGNNEDIARLRRGWSAAGARRCFVVRSNFQTEDPGWNVLKYFRQLPSRFLDKTADRWFGAENDLVVDKESMSDLADGQAVAAADILDFGSTGTVHHCNYFKQLRTAKKLAEWLLN